MQRARLRAGAGTLILVLTGVVAHEAAGHGAKTIVRVTEKEWAMKPVPTTAKPGPVTFVVKNNGQLEHEFVVVKTNLAPGKLPVKGTKVREVGRVGKIPPFKPGSTKQISLDLKAGKYVLFCNVSGHYKLGQRTGFKVG